MVVRDLDIVGVAILEAKTDSPRVVDRDGVLVLAVSFEGMQPIATRDPQIFKARRQVDVLELANRSLENVRREAPRPAGDVERLGLAVGERLDHRLNVICHVTNVNRALTVLLSVGLECGAQGF